MPLGVLRLLCSNLQFWRLRLLLLHAEAALVLEELEVRGLHRLGSRRRVVGVPGLLLLWLLLWYNLHLV